MALAADRPPPAELPLVDLAFVPGDDASTPEAATSALSAAAVPLAVVTGGAAGSIVFEDGAEVSALPASVGPVVDTLGAGDALAAGFAFEYLRTGNAALAHAAGVRLASATCAHYGGTLGPRGEWDVPLRRRSS
jgi:sugar/nucleoside kinase (ribokinase family)